MTEECDCKKRNIMILACSGNCNAGQLANRAAVELTEEGFGAMLCLAGIAAGLSAFVQSATDADLLVVIDGCECACGRAILENAGIPLEKHVVVTQLGIRRSSALLLKPEDLAVVKDAVRLAFKYSIKAMAIFKSPKPLSPADQARSRMLGGKCC